MVLNQKSNRIGLFQWFQTVVGLPWFDIVLELWRLRRKVLRGLSNEGIYEVREYETTLELQAAKFYRGTC